jgi:hypothetical protein
MVALIGQDYEDGQSVTIYHLIILLLEFNAIDWFVRWSTQIKLAAGFKFAVGVCC